MSAKPNLAGEAINKSRNERQKAVLLVEVVRQACATSARLVEQTKRLVADTRKLHEEIREENRAGRR